MSKESNKTISRRKFLGVMLGSFAGLLNARKAKAFGFECSYSSLLDFNDNLQKIIKNPLSKDNDARYRRRLNQGIGYVTLHKSVAVQAVIQGNKWRNLINEQTLKLEELTIPQRRMFDLTSDGLESVTKSIVDNQENLTPEAALESGKYVGLIAVPSPLDIGRRLIAYKVEPNGDNSKQYESKFLGIVLVSDCVQEDHWVDEGYRKTYGFAGWEHNPLPWIAESSEEFNRTLPPGRSGDPDNVLGGRPGLLLLSEERYFKMNNLNPNNESCKVI